MRSSSKSNPAHKACVQANPLPTFEAIPSEAGVQIWRIKQVENCTGLKKSMIYLLIARGEFPANFKITRYTAGWLRHEVEAWVQGRVAASRQIVAMPAAESVTASRGGAQ
jgi:prophage regulatory protein